jgi:hypothetical protein
MRTARLLILGAILSLAARASEAPAIRLRPLSGLDGSSDQTTVWVSVPTGWQGRTSTDEQHSAGFHAQGPKQYIFLDVTAYHRGHTDLWDGSARHSYLFLKVIHDGEITECKPVEVFDAREHGKLQVWRLRSSADDYYFVFFRKQNTVIEAYLRSHDADALQAHVGVLKELVRSTRIEMHRSNQAIQRTVGRSVFRLSMTSTLNPQRRPLSPAVADLALVRSFMSRR